MSAPWIGVDLDRTLAHYSQREGPNHIGEPIPKMLERVKQWLAQDICVRIVTARVYSNGTVERNFEAQEARLAIERWCYAHLGEILPITCTKDFDMLELWDDRCVQVIPNTGERADGKE